MKLKVILLSVIIILFGAIGYGIYSYYETVQTVKTLKTELIPLNILATEIINTSQGGAMASSTDYLKSIYYGTLQIQQSLQSNAQNTK